MNISKLEEADQLFKEGKINAHDVMLLAVIESFDDYEKQQGKRMTWNDYKAYALDRMRQASLQNINNVN